MRDNQMPQLSPRKKQILFSAIDNYIKQASPITSLLVQQTKMHDLSTATIRNELNTLEQMGYLKQLHTSSGRVPTTMGYRFFVNEILNNAHYTPNEIADVKEDMFMRTNNLSEIVKTIADTVSKTTNYPAVVVFNGFDQLSVNSIKVFHLISGQLLILIETNAGVITNTISASTNITKQDCENASKIFSDIFAGKNIQFLMHNVGSFSDRIQEVMRGYEEIFDLVVYVLENYTRSSGSDVTSKGIVKLLNSPEYSNVEKAKDILNILDDKTQLKDIFDTTDEDGVIVKIGDEIQAPALQNCAVITTPIVIDGNKIASVGIIGPERIDYANIASTLKYISDQINSKRGFGNKDSEED